MAKNEPSPLAFMSYVRVDDKHENGRLTEFRDRLSGEVRMQTGEDFPIFQDRNDILWGQNWKERIEDSLDEVTFLIPIITPSFFNSAVCRDELERFLDREKKLKRTDLILPVYYVGSAVLDEDAKRAKDTLAQEIAKHQFADWRDLRFEPFTSPQVGKTFAQLAMQIRKALEREKPAGEVIAKHKTSRKRSPTSKSKATTIRQPIDGQTMPLAQVAESTENRGITKTPSAKTEPPTIIVDPLHRGDFPTISEAIAHANAGYKILVRPGLYQEGLVIDKPLEIIGDGEPGEIVIHAIGQDAILFKTTMDRISNLSLQQMGGGRGSGVDIAQGRLEMEGCDITSQNLACVAIHGSADPRLRRNRIHDGKGAGVYVYENGQGTLEDNDIFNNAYTGIEIRQKGNPLVQHNRINNNIYSAIYIHDDGAGIIEDNDLRNNGKGAWFIAADSEPKVKRARNQE